MGNLLDFIFVILVVSFFKCFLLRLSYLIMSAFIIILLDVTISYILDWYSEIF
jgi:hypothetical protein